MIIYLENFAVYNSFSTKQFTDILLYLVNQFMCAYIYVYVYMHCVTEWEYLL